LLTDEKASAREAKVLQQLLHWLAAVVARLMQSSALSTAVREGQPRSHAVRQRRHLGVE